MRSAKFFPMLVVMAVLLANVVPTAMAQGTIPDPLTSTNPCAIAGKIAAAGDKADEVWAALSADEQARLLECLTVDHSETEVAMSPQGATPAGCRTATYSVSGKNVWGQTLYTYYQSIYWCYNGSTITSKSRSRYGRVGGLGWEFVGNVSSQQWGGVGSRYYRSWTQGHFQLCVVWGCIQHKYPQIDMTVNGNGTWTGYGYPE